LSNSKTKNKHFFKKLIENYQILKSRRKGPAPLQTLMEKNMFFHFNKGIRVELTLP